MLAVEKVDKTLLQNDVFVTQAPEPSEILWHNRHVTYATQRWRKIGVFIACLIFLFGMFLLFTWMKSKAIKNMWRYPSTTNCQAVSEQFRGKDGEINDAYYQEYAQVDKDLTTSKQGTGIYQCYCREQVGAGKATENGNICNTWFSQAYGGYAIGECVTIAITVVNTIIRSLCIWLIKMIGYHTETGEITAITSTIFIATFFNTAILLLLADANLSQVKLLSWIPGLNGPFPDITEQWYIIIAPSMIMTMFLNSIYPYIDLGISFATLALFRCLDQGFSTYLCCKKEKTTKCKTIQAYVNTYSGPEHVMSYKYSGILTTVCVTFWYGVAIPELFPIAAFTFFNYYIVDRFLITYYYRRPPIYDDKLNRAALGFMQAGPVMLLLFGYWCMGNMQIFTDNVKPLMNASVPLTTDHKAYPSHSTNQALPMFIVGLTLLIGLLFWDFVKPLFKKLGLGDEEDDIVVDEKVGSFYECVSVADRKRWYAEELHAVKDLGISSMGKYSVDSMRSAVGGWRVIKNAPNYEILSNIKY